MKYASLDAMKNFCKANDENFVHMIHISISVYAK